MDLGGSNLMALISCLLAVSPKLLQRIKMAQVKSNKGKLQGKRLGLLIFFHMCSGAEVEQPHKPQHSRTEFSGFPGGAVVENPPANAGDMGSSPDPGRSHMPRSN